MTARSARFDVRRAGKPILIGLGVFLLTNVLVSLLLVQPKIREFRRLKDSSEPQIKVLKEMREAVEAREEFLAALRKAEEDLVTLRSDVMSTREKKQIEIQAEVEAICADLRIEIENVNFDNADLDDEQFELLVGEAENELRGFVTRDGPVRFDHPAIIATARKP